MGNIPPLQKGAFEPQRFVKAGDPFNPKRPFRQNRGAFPLPKYQRYAAGLFYGFAPSLLCYAFWVFYGADQQKKNAAMLEERSKNDPRYLAIAQASRDCHKYIMEVSRITLVRQEEKRQKKLRAKEAKEMKK